MREALKPYHGANALNYVCVIATEILQVNHLRDMPSLAAGFASVINTLPIAAARALKNLRAAGHAPATLRELRLMVDQYNNHHERRLEQRRSTSGPVRVNERGRPPNDDVDTFEARFQIDERLNVTRRWGRIMPKDVSQAVQMLTGRLPPREWKRRPPHDPLRRASATVKSSGFRADVEPLGFTPLPPPTYDLARKPRAVPPINWADLVSIADQFDNLDVDGGRQQPDERRWYNRLYDSKGNSTAILKEATQNGLQSTDILNLSGIKHLIGLPGAGKTTLLYLLGAYFAQRGYRACFLFPSIEVSTRFAETLSLYDIPAALLFGQSEASRTRHVANFSASLSSKSLGLGVTRSTAPFFATNCALAGFASDEEEAFPHSRPPCEQLEQRESQGRRYKHCALASVCGRQYSERALISMPLWVGHVLSMDRAVTNLFSDHRLQHFEYLARTFDVLIIDECDGAQNMLDARGTPMMKLSGSHDSVWSHLIQDFHGAVARGSNAFVSQAMMPHMLEMTGRFGRATDRLMSCVKHLSKPLHEAYKNKMMTTVSLIADLYHVGDPEGLDNVKSKARDALEKIWDLAAKEVAFRNVPATQDIDEYEQDPDENPTDIHRAILDAALDVNVPEDQLRALYQTVFQNLERWDATADKMHLLALSNVLRHDAKSLLKLESEHDANAFFEHVSLLATVSLLVLQHFGLAPHLRLLNAQGLVGDDVFESRPSKDMLGLVSEALVGRLSGVRYTISEEGNVEITHISFVGTPRLLPERMNALGVEDGEGPAVLYTSATSMLEASPSFHVSAGPHYVLHRPNAGSGWTASKYTFKPLKGPDGHFLRFSGAKMSQRERMLRTMAEELLRGGAMSDVESALNSHDVVDGVGRKAAFVLNSYDQCEMLFSYIQDNHPEWRGRVRYLVRAAPSAAIAEFAITASEIERLGEDPKWDLLLFPMNAIGRGVNIVYRFGPRIDKAMIGSLFFLTRPHPRSESLQLMQGIIGRASEDFDGQTFHTTDEALQALSTHRHSRSREIRRLLRLPLAMGALGSYAKPFVADQMIMILQTIGRAMRGDCPAYVYFIDAAWAPNSAHGLPDTAQSSMLVMIREILAECLNHADQSRRECYQNLYTSFSIPMNNIEGLVS
ncbi:MAG TPA: hypothetical protein VHP37_32395 [Burkholderiales bacterium]|nr:hypothetical protein [Burkholderiales bacterium]